MAVEEKRERRIASNWLKISSDNEIFSLEELVKEFDYHRISKSPAVFDMTKLRWMNSEYMKKMDDEAFYEMALPYMKEVITKDVD